MIVVLRTNYPPSFEWIASTAGGACSEFKRARRIRAERRKMMKKLLVACVVAVATSAMAQTNPNTHPRAGYVTQNGTYVPPSVATEPNDNRRDNFTTRGNTNPYTGRPGTVDPDKPLQPRRPTAY